MGKLFVPNVYLDVDLLKAMAANYNPNIRVVRSLVGVVMIDLSREGIIDVFKLNLDATEPINLKALKKEYENNMSTYRVKIFPMFMVKGKGGIKMELIVVDKEPFPIDMFDFYFVRAYHTLFQIIGFNPPQRTPMDFVYMASNIQNPMMNKESDFATYLYDSIHKELIAIKNGETEVRCWWYSLLCHMFLARGINEFGQDIQLELKGENDEHLPIQCWTHHLDMHY